jgi:hypothetical protein
MISERTEFLISQHLDGQLSPVESDELQSELSLSSEARQMLADYDALDALVRANSPVLPAIQWNKLSGQISAAVALAERSGVGAGDSSSPDAGSAIQDAAPADLARADTAAPRRLVLSIGRRAPVGARLAIGPRLALAASILLAVGIGIVASRPSSAPGLRSDAGNPIVAASPAIQVTGPLAETAAAPPVVDIAVGPSDRWTRDNEQWQYAQGVVEDPATITIASAQPDKLDLRN